MAQTTDLEGKIYFKQVFNSRSCTFGLEHQLYNQRSATYWIKKSNHPLKEETMGRGSKAKKSQGPRFTEQNMPSKTPIVIPTLNKALGSKSVRGHKHLKLTFGLSQGLFFLVKSSSVQQSTGMEDLKHSGLPAAGDKWQLQSQSCEQRVPNSPLEQHLQGSSHYKPCFTDLHDSCLVWQGESGKPEGLWRTGPVFEP